MNELEDCPLPCLAHKVPRVMSVLFSQRQYTKQFMCIPFFLIEHDAWMLKINAGYIV